MVCFEAELNGVRLARSGSAGGGLLGINIGLYLDSVADEGQVCTGSFLTMGGLFDRTHLRWASLQNQPMVGDVITIRVVSADHADAPERSDRSSDPAVSQRNRYASYLAFREEFETGELQGKPIDGVDPELARAARRRLFLELRKEFDPENRDESQSAP
jgi:hypothetical protein